MDDDDRRTSESSHPISCPEAFGSGELKINNFQFCHTKACVTKFDLGVKWVRVNQGHNLNNLGSPLIDNATY